ncbi:MAG: TRAP transporter small permease [Anaerovoracaceae bacterium]|jgi:TRAP-type C4-dicarboxylate transport system permease small subunit
MQTSNKNVSSKILHAISNADVFLGSCALVFLVGLTFIGVIMRRFFNAPLSFQEELQVFCILWLVYITAGAVFRTTGHISIEILVEMFSKKIQWIFSIVVYVITIVTLIYTLSRSLVLVEQLFTTSRLTNILKIPYGYLYLSLPVGCVLMMISNTIVFIKRDIIEHFRGAKDAGEVTE